jgi:hypothetical protein
MPMLIGASVDDKVVDKQCLTGFLTRLSKLRVMREHINKTRLAYVTSANKSIFWNGALWALHYVWARDYKRCKLYHNR